MTVPQWPFVGSEVLQRGLLRKHHLRASYRAVLPDVYVPRDAVLDVDQRARAAWLWSHRQGVLAGLTASALHGAKWIDATSPLELIWPNARRPVGIRTYDFMLGPDESELHGDMRLTTVPRTAFDLGRRGTLHEAVARLDALGNATGLTSADVLGIARRHRGARGLRQLEQALALYDPGAASPRETWLRLLLLEAGYPRPQTQIPVVSPDGRRRYFLDMGWQDRLLTVEYDGEHHRVDPTQYAYDIQRSEDILELGWTRVRVVKRHRSVEVLARVARAWTATSLRGDRRISLGFKRWLQRMWTGLTVV
ncbi:hypothetical protein, partial [Mycolicibacterium poriferae]